MFCRLNRSCRFVETTEEGFVACFATSENEKCAPTQVSQLLQVACCGSLGEIVHL